jgi:hypothetical protein
MNTQHFLSTVARLVVGAACAIGSAACGSDMLRTGRAPVYLVITDITSETGGGETSSGSLLSDVAPVFNDIAQVTISAVPKNPTVPSTAINDVTLTRYRVVYRRTDGRNTPGVDVPYGFDGGLSVFIPAGGSGTASFDIVRHQAKLEPPLRNLTGGGGQIFISTIAEMTFYGHDQNGNEVAVTGRMDIQFADFADE